MLLNAMCSAAQRIAARMRAMRGTSPATAASTVCMEGTSLCATRIENCVQSSSGSNG